jgi:DtxR family Mn-dependent transcriptional regulator
LAWSSDISAGLPSLGRSHILRAVFLLLYWGIVYNQSRIRISEGIQAVVENQTLRDEFSEAIEDFLKAVYLLQQEHDRVQTSVLADALGITAPSTTEMAKRLAKANLVVHEPYRGIRLTSAGERIALEVVRNHRLLELFLVEALGYAWDEVHEEAERLEHAVSERLIERIAQFLGNPRYDLREMSTIVT